MYHCSQHSVRIFVHSAFSTLYVFSIFYVFYEQYLTIVHDTVTNLAICMSAILVVTFILLGFDLYSAIMVFMTICMILCDLFGLMYLWDISLNAVSLVNLIMVSAACLHYAVQPP